MIRTTLGCFAILVIAILAGSAMVVASLPQDTMDFLIWAMEMIVWMILAVPVVIALCAGVVMLRRGERRERTYIDGALPLMRRKRHIWRSDISPVLALWSFIFGEEFYIDPNRIVGSAFSFDAFGRVREVEPAAGWAMQHQYNLAVEGTNHIRAALPGDDVRNTFWGRDSDMPRLPARALNGRQERPQLTGPVDDDEVEGTFAPAAMSLDEAIAQSTPNRFVLGHNDKGEIVSFDPSTQQNLGIVGATGTGKTTTSGYHVLLLALKFGWHPLILDPKGGVDLRPFAQHGEWRPTDADVFGEQIAAVRQEHERRHELLVDHQVANIDELHSRELPHILVFCEEYGALWEEIETGKKRSEVERINGDIDAMMRLSRMTGIHFCFVDQFPEKWSQQVFMATKMRLVYQVAPGQDSYLREYKADALPDRGAFMYRRQVWNSWHVQPQLRTLLFDVPASQFEIVEYRRQTVPKSVPGSVPSTVPLVVAPPPPNAGNDEDRGHKWEEFARDWNTQNPTGGPSALARAMWTADGCIKPYTDYKSEAARRLDVLRQPSTVADQLDALGLSLADVRMPRGGKLGIDPTHGA